MNIFKVNPQNISFKAISTILFFHLIVIIGLPIYLYYRTPSLGLLLTSLILFILTGLSITAGYHRLYAHRAYKASKVVEFFLLFFGVLAMQSNAIWWCHKHRSHHRFVDTEKDPHNINKGFWWAHVGWLLEKSIPFDKDIVQDLMKNKMVLFQNKYYYKLSITLNIIFFLVIGYIFNDYFGAFVIAWWGRIALLNNSTWFINSLAHTFGEKTYAKEQTAVNNAAISLLTFGEGYHNYHHAFSSDYRNGVRWWQWDPTKWSIWLLSKVGLVSDLRTIDPYVARKLMITEDRKIFLEALQKTASTKKHALQQKVSDMHESLSAKIIRVKHLVDEYKHARAEKSRNSTKHLKKQIKEVQTNIKLDFKNWLKLEREISKVVPLQHHHA